MAFFSYASNFVAGDERNTYDLFVKDLETGTVTLIGPAAYATISLATAGRYEAFHSDATDLVAGDTNNARDVFVKDLQTGAIIRASISADGTQANNWSQVPSISADGRYVAFESYATNLVGNDTNANANAPDIFVKNLQTGTIIYASTAADGTKAQGGDSLSSTSAFLSANGRYVAFNSSATNLVSGDTNGKYDIFIKDLQTGAIARVNAADGAQPNGDSGALSFSADGRYVAFSSLASNLVTGDTNRFVDVFIAPNPFFPSSSGGSGGPVVDRVVYDTLGTDVLTGGAGNDTIYSYGGNDTIYADGGNDYIVLSGSGTSLVMGGYGDDTVVINSSGLPSAQGVSGILIGGLGNDTYQYNLATGGNIQIIDFASSGQGNSLVFGHGIDYGTLRFGFGSLLIQVGDNGGTIHLENFDPNDVYGAHAIETFKFADGTALSYADLIAKGFDLTGTTGDDTITGTNATDRITGVLVMMF